MVIKHRWVAWLTIALAATAFSQSRDGGRSLSLRGPTTQSWSLKRHGRPGSATPNSPCSFIGGVLLTTTPRACPRQQWLCRHCHANIYQQWSQTGMAKMFRPYRSENVVGDFTRNNTFYEGDHGRWANGDLKFTSEEKRTLYARMIVDGGRHALEIRQPDGWHRCPVDTRSQRSGSKLTRCVFRAAKSTSSRFSTMCGRSVG